MNTDVKIKPGKWWYYLAIVISVIAIISSNIFCFMLLYKTETGFRQIKVPCAERIDLTAGKYLVLL